MNGRIRIVTILLLTAISYCVMSQQYPVQVTTTITPPYSVYLSDYISPGSASLQILVHLLELDRPNLQIKFRITIEGAGITLRTKPSYVPRPSTIQGGVPELFTGDDLSSYFHPDNLEFIGITPSRFLQQGRLPEGFYTFTIEVLEYNRSVRISNLSMANAWIVLNDPPLINTPFNGDKLRATDPQNIMFSWTPRHMASPNAAFSTEYEFTLIELYPGQTNPEVAIRSSNSIFKTTTNLTSLNYSILEPTLIPGKSYAFRIRAFDTSGRDLFKNQGYSETYVFQYGDACVVPTEIVAKALDPKRARISWEAGDGHTGFDISYRVRGRDSWFEQGTSASSQILADLAGEMTYEYRVTPRCGSITGSPGPILTFTTPNIDESGFVCGAPVPEFEASPDPLMKPLLPLDMIQVGDWSVNLLNVYANGDGSYAGTGYASVPGFNLANVRVTFDRILVNEDYRVIAGDIKSVYSADSKFVVDLTPVVEEVREEIVEEPSAEEMMVEDLTADVLSITIPADIGTVAFSNDLLQIKDESGKIIEEQDLPPEGEELTITDENGDVWVVDGEGGITIGGAGTDSEGVISSEDITVGDSLIAEGISTDLNIVSIDNIPETFKLKEGRMNITYTIKDTLNLSFSKLEIFKLEEEDTLLINSYQNIDIGESINFTDTQDQDSIGWSGKDSNGEYARTGQYLVALTATIEAEFENGFEEIEDVEIHPFDISLTEDVDFIGFDRLDPTGCYRRAADMLETAGYETVTPTHDDVIQMTRANENGVLTVQDGIEDGINLINEYLDDEIPIMVGADYHSGHPGNVDETTDHWLVIVGRSTTNNQTCFRYYDAQTAQESIGTGTDNLLCEQNDHTLTDTFRAGSQYERVYTVTMVRPSIEIEQ